MTKKAKIRLVPYRKGSKLTKGKRATAGEARYTALRGTEDEERKHQRRPRGLQDAGRQGSRSLRWHSVEGGRTRLRSQGAEEVSTSFSARQNPHQCLLLPYLQRQTDTSTSITEKKEVLGKGGGGFSLKRWCLVVYPSGGQPPATKGTFSASNRGKACLFQEEEKGRPKRKKENLNGGIRKTTDPLEPRKKNVRSTERGSQDCRKNKKKTYEAPWGADSSVRSVAFKTWGIQRRRGFQREVGPSFIKWTPNGKGKYCALSGAVNRGQATNSRRMY